MAPVGSPHCASTLGVQALKLGSRIVATDCRGRTRVRWPRLPPYYLLLTTDYLLLATYYLLPTTYYSLLTTYYILPTTYYLLLTTYYLVLTTYYLLLATYYLLLTTYYLLLTTYYPGGLSYLRIGQSTCRGTPVVGVGQPAHAAVAEFYR